MTSIAESKKALRARITAALAAMPAQDRAAASGRLGERLWAEPRFLKARSVFWYVSMPEEVDTRPLVRRCLAEGRSVSAARVVPGAGVIEARELKAWDGSFIAGPFGILEPDPAVTRVVAPSEIDCVIVPGLAFDREGYRLGRGKGYYDRFLSGLGPRAARIALAFEFQITDRVPREPHDQTVDLVLSA
jgi:5-formyltetrahydrofolate cyclo-ligase